MRDRNQGRDRGKAALSLWGLVHNVLHEEPERLNVKESRVRAKIKELGITPVYPRRNTQRAINQKDIDAARKKIMQQIRVGFGSPVMEMVSRLPSAPNDLSQSYRRADDPEDALWVYLVIEMLLARMPEDYRKLAVWTYANQRLIETAPVSETQQARWQRHYRLVSRVVSEMDTVIDQTILAVSLRKVS